MPKQKVYFESSALTDDGPILRRQEPWNIIRNLNLRSKENGECNSNGTIFALSKIN